MPELSNEAWAQIRYDYEHTDRTITDICAEHGISDGTLRDRMRRWDWTRRRSPIPREGPPALTPQAEPQTPTPWLPGPRSRGDERDRPPPQSPPPADVFAAAPLAAPADPIGAPAASDPAAIAARLQGAVAQVLPAIEATIARLAAGAQRPREMEQTARALGTLMRTLRELNALLALHPLRADDDDPVPEDIDEMRLELARRIRGFIAARHKEKSDDAAPPEATPAGS